ncbi:hypothetical protein [Bifidobacterium commune]|uniref:hypothetical protein n=1 Tax=Bifidobacterium commune TaxID=1505727 RepID=UPI00117766DA|nr:hypothetical protein [Bifidobacterium commune]
MPTRKNGLDGNDSWAIPDANRHPPRNNGDSVGSRPEDGATTTANTYANATGGATLKTPSTGNAYGSLAAPATKPTTNNAPKKREQRALRKQGPTPEQREKARQQDKRNARKRRAAYVKRKQKPEADPERLERMREKKREYAGRYRAEHPP